MRKIDKGLRRHSLVQREQLLDLDRGVENAKKIASIANLLFRMRIATSQAVIKGIDSSTIEILLKLVKTGGSAPISSLTMGSVHQTVATLKEMEKNNLVKIFRTPFRTYVVLTDRGWKILNELINVLT